MIFNNFNKNFKGNKKETIKDEGYKMDIRRENKNEELGRLQREVLNFKDPEREPVEYYKATEDEIDESYDRYEELNKMRSEECESAKEIQNTQESESECDVDDHRDVDDHTEEFEMNVSYGCGVYGVSGERKDDLWILSLERLELDDLAVDLCNDLKRDSDCGSRDNECGCGSCENYFDCDDRCTSCGERDSDIGNCGECTECEKSIPIPVNTVYASRSLAIQALIMILNNMKKKYTDLVLDEKVIEDFVIQGRNSTLINFNYTIYQVNLYRPLYLKEFCEQE